MSLDFSLTVTVDTGGRHPQTLYLYERNYTHNVTPMWQKAGCYDALYNSSGQLAESIIPALDRAVHLMKRDPIGYRKLNPSNGWGDYDTALEFLRRTRIICHCHPLAMITISK